MLPPQSRWVRGRGVLAMILLAPFFVVAVLSKPYAGEGTILDLEFDLLGFILFAVGAGFRFWATLYIGGRKGDELARLGPYSICRNPLYFGTFLMLASLVVFLQSLTLALGAVFVAAVYLGITVRSEERRLGSRFGRQYSDYCEQVPRFIPNFRRYRSPEAVEVNLSGLQRECFNALRWAWVPVAGEGLAYVRTAELLPHLFNLP